MPLKNRPGHQKGDQGFKLWCRRKALKYRQLPSKAAEAAFEGSCLPQEIISIEICLFLQF